MVKLLCIVHDAKLNQMFSEFYEFCMHKIQN